MSLSEFLLPREKYAEESKKYIGFFSTFEIINDKQALFYFGANHSRDVNNPQYSALKEYWNKFLSVTNNKDKIIFVEGGKKTGRG
jgi:transcription elongation factor GreA-like protein